MNEQKSRERSPPGRGQVVARYSSETLESVCPKEACKPAAKKPATARKRRRRPPRKWTLASLGFSMAHGRLGSSAADLLLDLAVHLGRYVARLGCLIAGLGGAGVVGMSATSLPTLTPCWTAARADRSRCWTVMARSLPGAGTSLAGVDHCRVGQPASQECGGRDGGQAILSAISAFSPRGIASASASTSARDAGRFLAMAARRSRNRPPSCCAWVCHTIRPDDWESEAGL